MFRWITPLILRLKQKFLGMVIDEVFVLPRIKGCQDYHYINIRNMYAKNVCHVITWNRFHNEVSQIKFTNIDEIIKDMWLFTNIISILYVC